MIHRDDLVLIGESGSRCHSRPERSGGEGNPAFFRRRRSGSPAAPTGRRGMTSEAGRRGDEHAARASDYVGDAARLAADMLAIGRRARAAARTLALASADTKNRALRERRRRCAPRFRGYRGQRDRCGRGPPRRHDARLRRPPDARRKAHRGLAQGLESVAALADPVGRVLESWTHPNGLTIERVRRRSASSASSSRAARTSPPDAGALCLKAGNAAILRGGSDSFAPRR